MTNSNRAKVSVCIPVYGVEKYIERCARSLFEQTMKEDIEFIFVNDCTKDKSIEILEQVLSEYPGRKNQVKIIHHEKNKGLVAARKTGLAHASGDYIIHCDSDDWVDLNMYETMYNKAIETDADMVYCDYYIGDDNKFEVCKQKQCESALDMLNAILSRICHGSLCNKLYRSNIALMKLYAPEDIVMTEDLLRSVQMLAVCKKIVYIDSALYFYSQNSESIVHRLDRSRVESIMKVHDFLSERYRTILTPEMLANWRLYIVELMVVYPHLFYADEYRKYSADLSIGAFIRYFVINKRFKFIIFALISYVNYPLGCWCYKIAKRIEVYFVKHLLC